MQIAHQCNFQRSARLVVSSLAMAALLAGCSGPRLVDSDVTAFSTWPAQPPGPGTPYRFERLPSQPPGPQQEAAEAIARTALAKVGLDLNPAAARYSVQTVINTQIVDRGPYDGGGAFGGGFGGGFGGFGFGGPGVFLGGGSGGASVGLSFPIGLSQPYYKRDLTIQMRDLRSNQVVFESRALLDGMWSDTLGVLPAMLDAALRGFPQPPAGTRRVNVELPR